MSNKNKNGEGFTLIELVIYVSIFVVLITTITLFAMTFTEAAARTRIKRELSLNAYSAIKTMLYEIKRADNIYIPTSVLDVHSGQLSLQTSRELPLGENITYIDFYLDSDGKFYLKREGQNPQFLISENFKITNLEFEYIGSSAESIRIDLTIENDSPIPEYQYSYTLISSGSIRK